MKSKIPVMTILVSAALLATAGVALGDRDEHEYERGRGDEQEHGFFSRWFAGERDDDNIRNPESDLYVRECGSCHFPYQPGLLSAQSWERIMSTLDEHFGENAELPEDDQSQISKYLLDNAAGSINSGLSNKIIAAQKGQSMPIRISETRYFRYEHSEIPARMAEANPQVKSFSNCDSCHWRAKQGLYDEDYVKIPGFGRWDD
ncbi:MAG: diheme cytochrome c [Sedimenticola sp.]